MRAQVFGLKSKINKYFQKINQNEAEMRLLKEVLKMFIYKDAIGFIGNVGVWSDGMGGYVLVDLLTDNRLYIH